MVPVRRALRVVNPSPYMIYLQARGSILVASSPEILCHVGADRIVTNRYNTLTWPPLICCSTSLNFLSCALLA